MFLFAILIVLIVLFYLSTLSKNGEDKKSDWEATKVFGTIIAVMIFLLVIALANQA